MADEIYEACVTLLREKTRDKKQFPLVFDENCSYGFRRNLWGLKPLGIAVSVVAVVAVVALPLVEPTVWSTALKDRMLVPLLVNLVLVVGWLSVVTPRWVKLAADAYGQRLLESCERL